MRLAARGSRLAARGSGLAARGSRHRWFSHGNWFSHDGVFFRISREFFYCVTRHFPCNQLRSVVQSIARCCIKSKDDKNFLYCLSYIRKPVVKDAQRPSHYTEELNNFDIFGIKFPVTLKQIAKFKQQNPDFSVNVYKLDKKVDTNGKLISLYTSPERNRKYHANLLQIGTSQKPHYVVINNMSRLLFEQTAARNKMFICKYCLATFSDESGLGMHDC